MAKQLTVVSLFTGCGGLDLGFERAGYKVLWANDNNEWACKTFEKNFHGKIVCGDIEKIDVTQIPHADVIIGGPPCQDFSQIWKQPGLRGNRGRLYLAYLKVLNHVKPKAFVFENVKGLMTMEGGKVIEKIRSDFDKAGYETSFELYNFAEYGVPQVRERVILVGIKKSLGKKFIKPPKTNTKDNFVSSGQALKGVEKVKYNNEHQNIKQSTIELLKLIPEGKNFSAVPKNSKYYVKGMISHVYRRLDRNKPSTTIIAGGGGGTWGYHYKEPRPLTNRERARLFGFPDDMFFVGTVTEVRRQIGNAVPPPAAYHVARQLSKILS